MQTAQAVYQPGRGWAQQPLQGAHLVLAFGSRDVLEDARTVKALRDAFPGAVLAGGSTAGEIAGTHVQDGSVVATAIRFADGHAQAAEVELLDNEPSEAAGARVATLLPKDGLVHVQGFSDGSHVNGSSLVRGMRERLPAGVVVTGGLAADGDRFQRTVVLGPKGAGQRRVVAVGLYGAGLHIGYGSLGGWDPFGPVRVVTRSAGNVLYELDGQPALALYKRYLGEHAAGLPATGLLFPLNIQVHDGAATLTRTILAVDEKAQSLTFAGDIPQGATARLMKANFDRLVDGAQGAAQRTSDVLGAGAELGLLISCVGRRLVLKQRTEEELEAVQEVLGPQAMLCGFYSYGEICPAAPGADCELHNQTMTITTLREG